MFGGLGIGLGAGSQGALVCISDVSLSSPALCRLQFFIVFFVMFQCGNTGFENLFSVFLFAFLFLFFPLSPLVPWCVCAALSQAVLPACWFVVLLTSSRLSLSPSLGELSRQQRGDTRGPVLLAAVGEAAVWGSGQPQ